MNRTARHGLSRAAAILTLSWVLLVLNACAVRNLGQPAGDAEAVRTFSGPLPFRSTMPLSLIFPHPPPDTASVLPRWKTEVSWNSTYSSVFIQDSSGLYSIVADGEILRTSFVVKEGIGKGVELQVEIPFLHYSGGFLDQTIEEFHDLFNLDNGKRERAPQDRFSVNYAGPQGTFFSARENGIHLGDVPVLAKVHLLESEGREFQLAARGLLELPTGNENSGFGSGRFDAGLGLVAQQSFDPSLTFYLGMDQVFRNSPTSFRGVHAASVTHLSLAAEKAFSSAFSAILQTDFQTKPLRDGHLHEFDRPEWSMSLGAGWKPGGAWLIKVFFSEGLTTDNAADFVAGLSVGARF